MKSDSEIKPDGNGKSSSPVLKSGRAKDSQTGNGLCISSIGTRRGAPLNFPRIGRSVRRRSSFSCARSRSAYRAVSFRAGVDAGAQGGSLGGSVHQGWTSQRRPTGGTATEDARVRHARRRWPAFARPVPTRTPPRRAPPSCSLDERAPRARAAPENRMAGARADVRAPKRTSETVDAQITGPEKRADERPRGEDVANDLCSME